MTILAMGSRSFTFCPGALGICYIPWISEASVLLESLSAIRNGSDKYSI